MEVNCFNTSIEMPEIMQRMSAASRLVVVHSHGLDTALDNLLPKTVDRIDKVAFNFANTDEFIADIELKRQNCDLIVIASYYQAWIFRLLHARLGLTYLNDIVFYEHMEFLKIADMQGSIGHEFFDYFTAHQDSFEKVYSFLSDENSKEMYQKLMRYRVNQFSLNGLAESDIPLPKSEQLDIEKRAIQNINDIATYVPEGLRGNVAFKLAVDEYSYSDRVSPVGKKQILNCGAYNNSSLVFSHLAPEAEIYAFEPQPDIHRQNQEVAKVYPNIKPVNLGLWDKSERLYFSQTKDAGGSSTGSRISKDEGDSYIDVISIDEFVAANQLTQVDFIKMDVEGAELEALDGAAKTIKHFAPQLAISIYHKPEHLHAVPIKIKQLLPEYKLYVGHRYPSVCETVCFATL